jgi:hypothetical protein
MLSSLLLKKFLGAQRICNLSSHGGKWNRRRRRRETLGIPNVISLQIVTAILKLI